MSSKLTVDEICDMASNGNRDALRFCQVWIHFCHVIDDLVDKDKPVNAEAVSRCLVNLILELSGNTFYLQHKAMLMGLIIQGANAWADSELDNFAREKDVLKGMWHEVVYHVAFLTGGWDRLRGLTFQAREYDHEGGS